MRHSTLSKWLKMIIIGVALCGTILYIWELPSLGQYLVKVYPEFRHYYYPWLIFLWLTGIPCYAVMALAWKIAQNIGSDHSFTHENGRLFRLISILAACDVLFVLVMNLVYFLLNMNHPGILLLFLLVVFAGIAVAVITAGLSTLVNQAADLQEQSDWTI